MSASIRQVGSNPTSTFVPGPGGYVIMVVISWLIFTALALLVGAREADLAEAVSYGPFVLILCATYGLPVAVVGTLLLGAVSGRLSPSFQVLAAALIGAALAASWVWITLPANLGPSALTIAVLTGLSAGAGRLLPDRWIRRSAHAR